MKAHELIIGDWILYGDKPVKVLQLSENSEYDWVKPILLTDEMLKLNGWEISKWNCILKSYKDDKVYMGLRGNDFVIWMDVEEYEETHVYYADYILPKPNYVHELQHCLRLVGLNDLANNFKILKK